MTKRLSRKLAVDSAIRYWPLAAVGTQWTFSANSVVGNRIQLHCFATADLHDPFGHLLPQRFETSVSRIGYTVSLK